MGDFNQAEDEADFDWIFILLQGYLNIKFWTLILCLNIPDNVFSCKYRNTAWKVVVVEIIHISNWLSKLTASLKKTKTNSLYSRCLSIYQRQSIQQECQKHCLEHVLIILHLFLVRHLRILNWKCSHCCHLLVSKVRETSFKFIHIC